MSARATTSIPTQLRVDTMRGPRFAAIALLLTLVGLFGAVVYWMSRASLDEVTPGFGKVIPSRQIQVLQSRLENTTNPSACCNPRRANSR